MSRTFDCTEPQDHGDGISAAAQAVREGELVVLPTDTVYGIGADAFDATAVASVLAAKGRGREMPPPVLIPAARTALGLATEIPDYANRLMQTFWPGPLTLVLKAHSALNWDLGDTNGTVALRVPDHPVALELLAEIGPMAVTSANTTGDPAARTAADAERMLGAAVSVYLDAGTASEGPASTIVDCTGSEPRVLRVGAVSQNELDAALTADDLHAAPGAPTSADRPAEDVTEGAEDVTEGFDPVGTTVEPEQEPNPEPVTEPGDAPETTRGASGEQH